MMICKKIMIQVYKYEGQMSEMYYEYILMLFMKYS